MNPFRLVLFTWVSTCVISSQAHPGHDLLEHGSAHVIGSPFHLVALSVITLFCFGLGALVIRPAARRALNSAGLIGLLMTVGLWIFGH